ncbi:hypothetical protein CNECB9_3930016 [Cupriavidus necator]|uniref:Uncharacterized protein n=1 Tax=Cupriavidus necator TaxID=106590 RepID=A0A1K0IK99_CUPNE|nr:hypothetical protein CNECB9_3930016 [Cupriavidus necator]
MGAGSAPAGYRCQQPAQAGQAAGVQVIDPVRGKPRLFRAGKDSADAAGVLSVGFSVWRLLLLDVLADDRHGCVAAATGIRRTQCLPCRISFSLLIDQG